MPSITLTNPANNWGGDTIIGRGRVRIGANEVIPMLTALTDLNAYRALHPTLSDANVISIADINGDGKWNNADIQSLLGYLQAGHGSAAAVPEPAT